MARLRPLLARARALDPRAADVLLGAVAVTGGLLELALDGGLNRPGAVAAVGLLATGFLVRRHVPLAAVVLGMGGLICSGLGAELAEQSYVPLLLLLGLLLDVGARVRAGRFAAAMGLGLGLGLIALHTDAYSETVGDVLFSISVLVVAPLWLGRFTRGRSELAQTLRSKATRFESDRELRAQAAVADERARIAAELHDAIAHALSAMVIQSSVARRTVLADPQLARTAFTAVEDTGREALSEVRRLLGVLRAEDADLALVPQPGLAHLGPLVRRARAAGLAVDLEVSGTTAPLCAGVDLTAYRVVQEALDGAVAQGDASSARVRLRHSGARLDIRIDDDGGTPAGGRALLGIRERLAIYGGELNAGVVAGSGHAVHARIPVEGSG